MEYKYDDKGNKPEQVVYRTNGPIHQDNARYWEYQYDSTGNNTKKSEYRLKDGKKKLYLVTELTYTYY